MDILTLLWLTFRAVLLAQMSTILLDLFLRLYIAPPARFDLAHTAREWYKKCLRFSGPYLHSLGLIGHDAKFDCVICEDACWDGDRVVCSSTKDIHAYCPTCFIQTIEAMLSGNVKFSYDPVTTLPLCCFCPPEDPHTVSIDALSASLQRRWERQIISIQLQGLPTLTCVHCGFLVLDEDTKPAPTSKPSLGKRLLSYITPNPPPRTFKCPECFWTTCLACSFTAESFKDHKCKSDDLRLEIEKSIDRRLIYTCPRCSKRLIKDGGCNHCTCICGAEYCHLCHADLSVFSSSSSWRFHFCDHFNPAGTGAGGCEVCTRCPLYGERDDEGIRREIERRNGRWGWFWWMRG